MDRNTRNQMKNAGDRIQEYLNRSLVKDSLGVPHNYTPEIGEKVNVDGKNSEEFTLIGLCQTTDGLDVAVLECEKGWCGTFSFSDLRKPFDITRHEWYCDYSVLRNTDNGTINIGDVDDSITINKDDAIAIAKALGVTAGDLK